MGKKKCSLEISKFSLALQSEALVNTSGRVLFSSPVMLGNYLQQTTSADDILEAFFSLAL